MVANEIKKIVPGVSTAMRTRCEGGGTPELTQWGADCEYGLLRDVLLGRPQYMQLLPTNSVSRLQLKSGVQFDSEIASAQHRELAAAFVTAGVRVHYLESDASLPYQVFARDSSVMTPYGAIVAQLSQWWRRGEHALVTRFFLDNGIPIYDIVTAGGFEGGDFNVVRPKSLLVGYSEERTQFTGAKQVQNWLEAEGWDVQLVYLDAFFVHLDVAVAMLTDRLAAVCLEVLPPRVVEWMRLKRIDFVPVTFPDMMALGCNVISLGGDRVLIPKSSRNLRAACQAHGLQVFDPDISMITIFGGGVHCLCQALRRDPG